MKKSSFTKLLGFLFLSSTFAVCSGTVLHAQQELTNGALETFTSGVPDDWTYDRGLAPDAPASIESTSNVSPFTNVYPASTASVLLFGGTQGMSLSQTGASYSGAVTLSFDFYLPSTTDGGVWAITPSSGATPLGLLTIYSNGDFSINDLGGIAQSVSLSASTWYQFSSTYDPVSGLDAGTITPFGGSSVLSWNRYYEGYPDGNDPTPDSITISNNSGDTPNLVVDNVSMIAGAVPEPSCGALLLSGLLGCGLALLVTNIKARVSDCL